MKSSKQILPVLLSTLCALLLAPPATAQETNNSPANSESTASTNTAANAPTPDATNEAAENGSLDTAGAGNLQPIVLFGQNAELKAGDSAEAVVVIGGSAKIHGHVREAVVVIGGSLEVDGEVGESVVAIFGNVRLTSGADIHQDAVAVLGAVSATPEVKIGGDAVAVGGTLDLADGVTVKGQKVSVGLPGPLGNLDWFTDWVKYCVFEFRPLAPQVGFVWAIAGVFFLIYLLIAAVFPHPVQVCVEDLNRRPATLFLMGLLTKLLVPFVYLILAVTGVGLLVVPIIWVALLLCAIVGKVALIEWLGAKLGHNFGGAFQKPLVAFLLGTILITLLYIIPVVGLLAYMIFGVWGLGSGITAAFSRLRGETPKIRHPRRRRCLPRQSHPCRRPRLTSTPRPRRPAAHSLALRRVPQRFWWIACRSLTKRT